MTHIHQALRPEDLVDVLFVWHEAMRRLGFTAEEIFVMYGIQDPATGVVCWGVRLQVGDIQWHGSVGTTTETAFAFQTRWAKFVEHDVRQMPQEKGKALWDKHMPLGMFQQLAAALVTKGLPLRSTQQ